MCHRKSYTFASCAHTEEVTTRCGYRNQWTELIPKRCLPGFKLPEMEELEGMCGICKKKAVEDGKVESGKGGKGEVEGKKDGT